MTMMLISLPIAIAVSLLWYLPCVKALGENRVLTWKDYWVIALVYGFLYCCLLTMVTEITWDAVVKRTSLSGLAKDICSNFLRAALLEEFFKFTGFLLAKKKYALNRKIEYMLVAGLVGMTYGIIEKTVLGNIGAVIVATICPMHIMWQLNQGGHWYEYEKAKAANDKATAKKEWCLAILLPFFFHGTWDTALDLVLYGVNMDGSVWQYVAAAGGLILVVFGVLYAVKTVQKVRKIAKETPMLNTAEQAPAAN